MKLDDHRHAGATIQRLMKETRQLENLLEDTTDQHISTRRAMKLLSKCWGILENARFELEEALHDQYRHATKEGIYRPAGHGRQVETNRMEAVK
jgi:hypothetical protein